MATSSSATTPRVDRTTNATGEIAALSLEELRELDNAYWFCPGEDVVEEPSRGGLRAEGKGAREP